jgi:hypothetical protein
MANQDDIAAFTPARCRQSALQSDFVKGQDLTSSAWYGEPVPFESARQCLPGKPPGVRTLQKEDGKVQSLTPFALPHTAVQNRLKRG